MKLLKKLRSRRGESLVEVLAAILILTMSMMVLAVGMSAAGKVSSTIKTEETSFTLANAAKKDAVVKLEDYEIDVASGYLTENGYYYYE